MDSPWLARWSSKHKTCVIKVGNSTVPSGVFSACLGDGLLTRALTVQLVDHPGNRPLAQASFYSWGQTKWITTAGTQRPGSSRYLASSEEVPLEPAEDLSPLQPPSFPAQLCLCPPSPLHFGLHHPWARASCNKLLTRAWSEIENLHPNSLLLLPLWFMSRFCLLVARHSGASKSSLLPDHC